MTRRPPEPAADAIRYVEWSVGAPIPKQAFEKTGRFGAIDGVIHLAHDWGRTAQIQPSDLNVSGLKILLDAVRAHDVARVVLGSSLSANRDALSKYGRTKWQMEQLLAGAGEVVARIGLVYGGAEKALSAR